VISPSVASPLTPRTPRPINQRPVTRDAPSRLSAHIRQGHRDRQASRTTSVLAAACGRQRKFSKGFQWVLSCVGWSASVCRTSPKISWSRFFGRRIMCSGMVARCTGCSATCGRCCSRMARWMIARPCTLGFSRWLICRPRTTVRPSRRPMCSPGWMRSECDTDSPALFAGIP